MIRPIKDLELYKYSLSDILFYANNFDDPITIKPLQVLSLTILKNYEKNIVPLMFMSLHVKRTEYEKIVTSMNTLTVEFSMYKTKASEDESNYNKIQYSSPYINGRFKAYNKDLLDTRVTGQLKNSIDDSTNSTQLTVELNLYLYDYQSILKYKKNKSYITTGTTNDLLFLSLKDRGFTNILISPSTPNINKDFIVPYGSLGDNFDFIDTYYGIYDNPRMFFADFDTTYLLDKGNSGKSLRKGELASTLIYLEKTEESTSSYNGCYIDENNGQYILNASFFSINDSDSMIDFNSAGKLKSMIFGTAEEFNDSPGDYAIENALLINNSKEHTQILFNIKDTKRTMNIEFSDIDLSIITPNKKYTLIPDSVYDSNYLIKGDYRLINSSIVFTRRTEDTMKCVIQCGFSKI